MRNSLFAILVAGLLPAVASDINQSIQSLGNDAVKGYLKPTVSALGSDLNQGWFREAPNPELWGIDVKVSLVPVGTEFATGGKRFEATTTGNIDGLTANLLAQQLVDAQVPTQTKAQRDAMVSTVANELKTKTVTMSIAGPTVIGSKKDSVHYTINANQSVNVNGTAVSLDQKSVALPVTGLGGDFPIPGVPMLYPQVMLGTIAGTQVTVRGLPGFEYEGSSFWGIGINHNPGFWSDWAQLPLGINSSVNFAYTQLKYGDYLTFSGWNAGVMASRRLGFRLLHVTPYVGVGIEGSSLDVKYKTSFNDASGNPISVGFSDDGENFFRGTVGANLRLGIIDLSADYTMAKYNSVSMLIGLGY